MSDTTIRPPAIGPSSSSLISGSFREISRNREGPSLKNQYVRCSGRRDVILLNSRDSLWVSSTNRRFDCFCWPVSFRLRFAAKRGDRLGVCDVGVEVFGWLCDWKPDPNPAANESSVVSSLVLGDVEDWTYNCISLVLYHHQIWHNLWNIIICHLQNVSHVQLDFISFSDTCESNCLIKKDIDYICDVVELYFIFSQIVNHYVKQPFWILVVLHKIAATPLLTQWSYYSLALSHWYTVPE